MSINSAIGASKYLSHACICLCFDRCGQVCKSWNEIIQQDKRASFRRRIHLSEVEAALEVGNVHISQYC